jgi:hypothetical protein
MEKLFHPNLNALIHGNPPTPSHSKEEISAIKNLVMKQSTKGSAILLNRMSKEFKQISKGILEHLLSPHFHE